ncbi:MAG: tail fiber domain-containing protein [Bacteroidetes bacterium]|nr:tail fiber domain-containing protein [Bacteroidota bacterium]
MKKQFYMFACLILLGLHANAQVTTTPNTSGTPGSAYVGWDSGISSTPLRIKHEADQPIEFYTNTGGGTFGTPRMMLDKSGSLGIGTGTSTPSSWLHVISTGTKETFRTDVPANEDNYWRMFAQGTEYGRLYHLYGTGSATGFYMVANRGNLRFGSGYGSGGGTVIPAMEITGASGTTGGNVLIGDYSVTSATSRLHIKGNGYTSLFKAENSTQSTPAFEVLETEQILGKIRDYGGSSTVGAFDCRYEPSSTLTTDAIGFNSFIKATPDVTLTGHKIYCENTKTSASTTQAVGLEINVVTNNTFSVLFGQRIFCTNNGGTNTSGSTNYGGDFNVSSITGATNKGLVGYAEYARENIGVNGQAITSTPPPSTSLNITNNVGLYGYATGAEQVIGVYGEGLYKQSNNTTDVYGAKFLADEGATLPSGVSFYGVWASAPDQTCSSGSCAGAAGYFDGEVFSTGVNYQSSDLTLKDNIIPLTNASTILDQLTPKQYTFNKQIHPNLNLPSGQHYGFISQEVETFLPGIVKDFKNPAIYDSLGVETHPSFSIKGLNYIEIIPILVGALKEQKIVIDSLIDALQNPTPLPVINPQNSQKISLSNVSSIILNQNDPNPFTESTRITFQIPDEVRDAKIIFTSLTGSIINTAIINERGAGELEVYSSELSKGLYNYTLVCDGKVIATKKMVKQ